MIKWRTVPSAVKKLSLFFWYKFRTGLNISWLALRDPSIGFLPKLLGAWAALVGVLPLEWIPGISPVVVLLADPILIPALLALAWFSVPKEHKLALEKEARNRPIPWPFLTLVGAIFLLALGVDTYLDFAYPGQDAFSGTIDPLIERWFES